MTEAEWNACTYPQAMLEFLKGKIDDRKLLLVTAGWQRRQGYNHSAVETERVADKVAAAEELETFDYMPLPREGALALAEKFASISQHRRTWPQGTDCQICAVQAALLRCIVGSLPFRPISLDRSWLSSPIPQLAESIYTDRAFDRLPILADALEDAGCTNADILNHCRLPGEHVRGCWVVDLLLGKK